MNNNFEKLTERYEKIVSDCEEKIEDLKQQLRKYEEYEEQSKWDWARHRILTDNENLNLPVPRLEVRYSTNNNWYNYTAVYSLVYKHLLENIICVPIGFTKIGGNSKKPRLSIDNLPFRDGAHIKNDMKQLNLPAYMIIDNECLKIEFNNKSSLQGITANLRG